MLQEKARQNGGPTAPPKSLIAIGELQLIWVSTENDRSNKKIYFDP